jgi:hypothetical protein
VRGARTAIGWVAHPGTIAAAAILMINDRLLKYLWPGAVTGKLSDVVGLVVAPALLGLALGLAVPRCSPRALAWLSLAIVGAGFSLVKTTDAGAAVASAGWSAVAGPSYILKDPTDLIALPALVLAWLVWRRAARGAPPRDAVVARIRTVVGVSVALLAVAGTSAPRPPDAVTYVEEVDGVVIIAGTILPYRSTTGVDNWEGLDDAQVAELGLTDLHLTNRQRQGCAPEDASHCYRIHGGELSAEQPSAGRAAVPLGGGLLGVDETTDGGRTWRTAWEIPASRWLFLAREHRLFRPRDDELLASVDVLVRAVPAGHQVIVANGADGLAVRDPDGTWHRVAVEVDGDVVNAGPVRIRPGALAALGHGVASEIAMGVLLGSGGLLIVSLIVGWRIGRVGWARAILWPVVAAAGLCLAFVGTGAAVFLDSVPFALFLAGCLAGAAVLGALVQRTVPRPRALALAAGGLLVAGGFVAPYLGWTLGRPMDYATATVLAWAAAGAALIVAAVVAWWSTTGIRPPTVAPVPSQHGSTA